MGLQRQYRLIGRGDHWSSAFKGVLSFSPPSDEGGGTERMRSDGRRDPETIYDCIKSLTGRRGAVPYRIKTYYTNLS